MATDFSRKLSLLRQEKGVSQRTAAKELEISQALLSHYENGIREPGLAFVVRACDYYRVSADYLLGRTLDPEGGLLDVETLYDASEEKGASLRGSVMATLQKKLVVNSISVLFDLLGKSGSRGAITAAGSYLSTAVYTLYRQLYHAAGERDAYFALAKESFEQDAPSLLRKRTELHYTAALREAEKLPSLSAEAITAGYPGLCQSVTQVLHSVEEQTLHILSEESK